MQLHQPFVGHEGQLQILGFFFLIIKETHDRSIKYEKYQKI